jgi:NAD(P)-dependent dehydrogenase (short-subunit alcohol dehydrogenase family)
MRTAIVTGATSGIGRAIAEILAEQGVHVIVPCRNIEKGWAVCSEISAQMNTRTGTVGSIESLPMDLLSLASVREFVQTLKGRNIQINYLINNAGAMFSESLPTMDGIERTIATNYTSVFALTMGLLPLMAQDGVIVNTLSVMVHTIKIDKSIFEIPDAKEYKRLKQYSKSKVALMYFTEALVRHLAENGAADNAGGEDDTGNKDSASGEGNAGDKDNTSDEDSANGGDSTSGGYGANGENNTGYQDSASGEGNANGRDSTGNENNTGGGDSTNGGDNASGTASRNIIVCATDPGVVNTNIITMHKWYDPFANVFARPFMKSPKAAAQITMRAINDRQNNYIYKGKSQKRLLPPLDNDFSVWLWNETMLLN